MSTADVAVQAFRGLMSGDFRVLHVIESAMRKHAFVPEELISEFTKFGSNETSFRLRRLSRMNLIRRIRKPYQGYTLNYAGYDCLAINAFVKGDILEAFGKPLGVGKEADVYDALNPEGERVAVKFHRLGRISFRQTIRKRGYTTERANWLFQSRLAATKEAQALKLIFPLGVAVPQLLSRNRHALVMGMIDGAELAECKDIPNPPAVLREILQNVRKLFLQAGIVHADLSEFNIIIRSDGHILIIDWPQYVMIEHANVQQLLRRDVRNVLRFFRRRFKMKVSLKDGVGYVTGEGELPI